jgi:hypothetical protein
MAYVPGQKVAYKQPRKIALAKVLVVAGLTAAMYFGVVFTPPQAQGEDQDVAAMTPVGRYRGRGGRAEPRR